MTSTSIVYLLGGPGVGKRTIAHALARRTGAVVVDNQTVNIPVMSLFAWDGRSRLPEEIWTYIEQIRDAMLTALENVAPPDLSYVLTNTLEHDAAGEALFARVGTIARTRAATFVPVFLSCQLDEQLRRVGTQDRRARMKLTDPVFARSFIEGTTFLRPDHPDLLELDTTEQAPDESAAAIWDHVRRLQSSA